MSEKKMSRIIGVDPGATGAFAYVTRTDVRPESYDVWGNPKRLNRVSETNRTKEFFLDIDAIDDIWEENGLYMADFMIFERPLWMPKDGQKQTVTAFVNYGRWTAIADQKDMPYYEVSPRTWKSTMGLINTGKEGSRTLARHNYPDIASSKLGRKSDHDQAEALLLAEYAHWHIFKPMQQGWKIEGSRVG